MFVPRSQQDYTTTHIRTAQTSPSFAQIRRPLVVPSFWWRSLHRADPSLTFFADEFVFFFVFLMSSQQQGVYEVQGVLQVYNFILASIGCRCFRARPLITDNSQALIECCFSPLVGCRCLRTLFPAGRYFF